MSYQEVLEAALALPVKKQEQLLDKLEERLAAENGIDLSPEWQAEIKRRLAEYRAGKAKTYTHADLKRKMTQLRKKRAKAHLPS